MKYINILKKSHGKLVLYRKPLISKSDILYSYVKIPMSEKQVSQLLSYLSARGENVSAYNTNNELVIDYNKYPAIIKQFNACVKVGKERGQFEMAPNKKYISNIPGTSVLLRDKKKLVIRIAFRKNNNTTEINRVCISNAMREEFFATVKQTHGRPVTGNYCLYAEDGEPFRYWAEMMDKIYNNLAYEKEEERKLREHSQIPVYCNKYPDLSLPEARDKGLCKTCEFANKGCWTKPSTEFVNKEFHTNYIYEAPEFPGF